MCNLSQGIREEGLAEAMDLLGVDEKIRAVIVMELQQEI